MLPEAQQAGPDAAADAPPADRSSSDGPRIAWIRDEAGLRSLADAWDALAATAARSPFAIPAWYEAWWRAFGSGEPALCTAWDGDRLTGVLPLARRRRCLHALANVHTPSFVPVAADAAVMRALWDAALAADARMVVEGLPIESDAGAALRSSAADRRRRLVVEPIYASPYIDLSGGWEGYAAETRKRWKDLERRRRKVEREHEVRAWTFEPVDSEDDLALELRRGYELEARGWKGRKGTAIDAAEDTRSFYTEVAHAFRRRGELVVSGLEVDGRLAAWDLSIVHGHRFYGFKTAFDEELRTVSPGMLLRVDLIRRCADEGIASVEMLGTDAPWKMRFATGVREHERVLAYGRSAPSTVRWGLRAVARPKVRSAYRAIRSSTGDGARG